ncbi:hypothetical protein HDU76_003440, partial [Blyttiomyces sp. JEL0837]
MFSLQSTTSVVTLIRGLILATIVPISQQAIVYSPLSAWRDNITFPQTSQSQRALIQNTVGTVLQQMYVNNAVKISDFGSGADVVSAYTIFQAAPPSADYDYYSGLLNVVSVANDLHLQYILPSPYACYSSLLPITFKRDIATSRNVTPVIKVIAKSTDADVISQLDSNTTLVAFQSISVGDTLVSYDSLPVATWIQQNANRFGGANDGARISRAIAAMTTLDHAHMLLPQQNSVQLTLQNQQTAGLYNVTLNWISRLTVECLNTTYIWKNDTVVPPIPSTPNSPNTLTTIPTIQKCYPGSFSQLFQFNTQQATTIPQQIRSYDGTQCISDFGAFPGNGAAIGLIPCPNSTTSSNSTTVNTTLWSFYPTSNQIINLASSLCIDIDYHWLNASIINNPNNTIAQSQNNTGFVWATLPGTALKQWDCGLNTTANWVISHVNSSLGNIVQVRTFDGYCWDNHYRSSFNQSISGSVMGAPAIVVHRRDNFVEIDYDNVSAVNANANVNVNKKRNDVDHGYSVPFSKRSFNWMSNGDFEHVKRDTTGSNNLTLGEDWSYSYTIINSQSGPVGYIQVKSFTPAAVQSNGDAQQSVQAILNTWVRLLRGPLQNTVALLIDVRENRGGNVLYAMELIQL